ncbi:MAG: hypothetical protein UDL61_03255, partial [Ruminococcus callidus]|uniref:hypothetical protein n=1 Tax=Ruminococcus callidus TaxID=40519 RepID=UPI002E79780A
LRFFFSLLKRKKEAKKEKSSRFTCTIRSSIPRSYNIFQSTKLPPAGHTGGLSAVTLPFLLLKSGRKVSGDPPQEKSSRFTCTIRSSITRSYNIFQSTKLPRRGIQAACPP